MRDPLDSTGWVVRRGQGPLRFAGTCFGFRAPGILLTAEHVVRGASPRDVSVTIALDEVEEGIGVREIIRHPTADIAILKIIDAMPLFDYFLDIAPLAEMGTNVTAFGYPEDTEPHGQRPTPRFFKGHVQRTFRHKSHLGYEYVAAELSFGAPGGLSGGPVAHEALPQLAFGVVAENRESSTFLASRTVVEGDRPYREEVRSMISYAACVVLASVRDWLDTQVPPGLAPLLE